MCDSLGGACMNLGIAWPVSINYRSDSSRIWLHHQTIPRRRHDLLLAYGNHSEVQGLDSGRHENTSDRRAIHAGAWHKNRGGNMDWLCASRGKRHSTKGIGPRTKHYCLLNQDYAKQLKKNPGRRN